MISRNRKAVIFLDEETSESGTVENIIECGSKALVNMELPATYRIYDCSEFIVNPGDRWENGVFVNAPAYKSDEQIKIEELETAVLDNSEMLIDMQIQQGAI